MDFKTIVKKWVLYNRIKYDKLDLNSIVSKVVAELPEIKQKIKEIIPEIKEIVKEVEKLSKEEALAILEKEFPEMLERKKEQREGLPELVNVKDTVVTRFAPNPNGYLHIGHAKGLLLSYLYARMYNGKFILRLEDTDPKIKRPILDAYERIYEDVKWLTEDKPDEFYIQSERLDIYYEYAKKLIEIRKAYVDLSPPDIIRKYRALGKPTEYREKPIEWHLEEWEKMINGEYDEGEAVLRIKTDIKHPNPSVRDWIAFRIINPEKNPHPWLEYKYGKNYAEKFWVWPTYNFSVSIDDHLMGVTHIFRMKEHEVNTIKQKYIFDYFNWEFPTVINYGAIIIKDVPFHKSEIRKLIEGGKITGWDDPFLPTLMGLRRRGIHPKAIKKYIIELGPSIVDTEINWEKIFSYNREIYDKIAKRYFIIENPVEVIIENLEVPKKIILKNHPENPELGQREYILETNIVYIEKEDAKNKYLRLMEGFNIEIIEYKNNTIKALYIDDKIETAKKIGAKIVQWVPFGYEKEIIIWKPNEKIKALGEKYLENVKEGEVIHAIRYCFLKKEKDYFIWMHK